MGTSLGLILTSHTLFRTIEATIVNQGSELTLSTDRTHKLHFGNWTLIDCGTERVEYKDGEYVHRFVPWAHVFVRSECEFAYRQLFVTDLAGRGPRSSSHASVAHTPH